MSRTRGYSSPSRRSKRLYENGYYQIEERHLSSSSSCIACNDSHSNCDKVSPNQSRCKQSSLNAPQSPSHARRTRPIRRVARHLPSSISSLPIIKSNTSAPTHSKGVANATSVPLISQQTAMFKSNNQPFHCLSSETLAAGERIPTKKKALQVAQAEVNSSQDSVSKAYHDQTHPVSYAELREHSSQPSHAIQVSEIEMGNFIKFNDRDIA